MEMKVILRLIKYMSIAVFVIFMLGVGQFGQLMASNYDVRKEALEGWAGADQERQEQVEDFAQVCLIGDTVKRKDSKEAVEIHRKDGLPEPVIKVCAEKHGYIELYEVANKADSILKSAAWPLSLLYKP